MRFINFAVVKFSVFLILGILGGHSFKHIHLHFVIPPLVVLLFVAWRISRKQLFQKAYFGLLTFACFFVLGYCNYQFRSPEFQPSHYATSRLADKEAVLNIQICEVLKPSDYYHKYIARVLRMNSALSTGKLLLLVAIDSTSNKFQTDNHLIIGGTIRDIPPPLNPGQFNYAKYMENQDVYRQLKVESADIIHRLEGSSTLKGQANRIRDFLSSKLDATQLGREERSILQALLLGDRREIDPALYASYAAAGAVHILAVSGLHVGILYLLISWVFRPLLLIRFGRNYRCILIVLVLWGFALMTGLSPSVTRAVSMFTFFGMAQLLNRPTNSINTLFLSLFFLLLINPKLLFQVGFQLSYLAVFFILWLQPGLSKLYTPRSYIDKKVWSLLTVSVAAQLGVAPLSIYYFNQFPGLFLLTNLLVLPFLGILVSLGLCVIILASLDYLPSWLANIYSELIRVLNAVITRIANWDTFVIGDIHCSGYLLPGSYLLIVFTALYLRELSYRRLVCMLTSWLILIAILFSDKVRLSGTELVVFHNFKNTVIGIKKKDSLIVYSNDSLKNYHHSFPVKPYRLQKNIKRYEQRYLKNVIAFDTLSLLIIDSTAVYPIDISGKIVLLSRNPPIHLKRLIDIIKPRQIIADGSNYLTNVKRWKETCEKEKLPFHHTGESGAFIIE